MCVIPAWVVECCAMISAIDGNSSRDIAELTGMTEADEPALSCIVAAKVRFALITVSQRRAASDFSSATNSGKDLPISNSSSLEITRIWQCDDARHENERLCVFPSKIPSCPKKLPSVIIDVTKRGTERGTLVLNVAPDARNSDAMGSAATEEMGSSATRNDEIRWRR